MHFNLKGDRRSPLHFTPILAFLRQRGKELVTCNSNLAFAVHASRASQGRLLP
jgi:hypothetical protein